MPFAFPYFTHFPTSPSFVWINTYSVPLVLFNLLYLPPAGFTATVPPHLSPKPAALPPVGTVSHTTLHLAPFTSMYSVDDNQKKVGSLSTSTTCCVTNS